MRLARAQTEAGIVTGEYADGTIHTDDGTTHTVDREELLAPCEPTALYCVGRNFAATLDQMDYDRPDAPDFFIKPPTSVLPTDRALTYPSFTEDLHGAGELAAVIDERCSAVAPSEVSDVVRGYTLLNDLDALDQPGRTARKAFDGSAPLGPWIETDVDPADLQMSVEINGDRDHEATTEQMFFGPTDVIPYISERLTLSPGDVIAFGSPTNVGPLVAGDTVAITYEGVGTLRTTIAASD
ncbi:MAG: fumarylacetoacetate hydrolase family protein [Halobacteriales archaeon]|nr:fumarylacetoacetate hydrolase family protein [Halobacteriales archaeon]